MFNYGNITSWVLRRILHGRYKAKDVFFELDFEESVLVGLLTDHRKRPLEFSGEVDSRKVHASFAAVTDRDV